MSEIKPLDEIEITELKNQVKQLDSIFGDNEDGTIVRLLATLDDRDGQIAELKGLLGECKGFLLRAELVEFHDHEDAKNLIARIEQRIAGKEKE